MRLTGTAMAGITVARRFPRNRNTTRTTRTKASASVRSTSEMVSFTKVVESCTTTYRKPAGKRAESFSRVALTALAVRTALAPGTR